LKLIDANLLLYVHDSTSEYHCAALDWWTQQLEADRLIGIPWLTVSAFLRISTHRALRRPLSSREAVEIVDSWFQYDQVRPISPGANFWAFFRQVVVEGQVVGPLMSDAKLAALALECGAMVSTNDLDFLRFQSVQVEFPLRQR
jgi:toxin-antitoxin system PIN domain toxin